MTENASADEKRFKLKRTSTQNEPVSMVVPVNAIKIDGKPFTVYFDRKAFFTMLAHACENDDREVGGLIIGYAHEEDGKRFLNITHFLVASMADEQEITFTFTPETWTQLDDAQEEADPNAKRLGWVHTHPNYGLFLSHPDMWIQTNWFTKEWQVALVIDPIREIMGFFMWVQDANGTLQIDAYEPSIPYTFDRNECMDIYQREYQHVDMEKPTASIPKPKRPKPIGIPNPVVKPFVKPIRDSSDEKEEQVPDEDAQLAKVIEPDIPIQTLPNLIPGSAVAETTALTNIQEQETQKSPKPREKPLLLARGEPFQALMISLSLMIVAAIIAIAASVNSVFVSLYYPSDTEVFIFRQPANLSIAYLLLWIMITLPITAFLWWSSQYKNHYPLSMVFNAVMSSIVTVFSPLWFLGLTENPKISISSLFLFLLTVCSLVILLHSISVSRHMSSFWAYFDDQKPPTEFSAKIAKTFTALVIALIFAITLFIGLTASNVQTGIAFLVSFTVATLTGGANYYYYTKQAAFMAQMPKEKR